MYTVIGIFEIVLRNSIDRHFNRTNGPQWLKDAVLPGGFLAATPACAGSFLAVTNALSKLGPGCSNDDLIAELTFGFWTYQFSKKGYVAAGNNLLQVFLNRPHGLHQKDVFKYLVRINDTRNRIAHYEPLCFDALTGTISCAPIKRRYDLIIEMLHWLGCDPFKILYGIDGVNKTLKEIMNV